MFLLDVIMPKEATVEVAADVNVIKHLVLNGKQLLSGILNKNLSNVTK